MTVPKNLCYIVLFKANITRAYSPIVLRGEMSEQLSSTIGMHGFDKDLLPALSALWYCAQLPRNEIDTRELSWGKIKFSQKFEIPQRILLLPDSMIGKGIPTPIPPDSACLLFFPDGLEKEAKNAVEMFDLIMEMLPFSAFSDESLKRHWTLIHKTFFPNIPQYCHGNSLLPISSLATILLSGAFLERRFNNGNGIKTEDLQTDKDSAFAWAYRRQMELSALANFERNGYSQEQLENRIKEYDNTGWPNFYAPAVLGVPGTPPRHKKHNHRENDVIELTENSEIERTIIDFVVTHRALARTGIGISSKEIPKKAYEILFKLENCWNGTPRPFKVWKYLHLLGRELDGVLDETAKRLLCRTNAATIFSDFPLGLGIYGDDTSPLLCRVPISCRPLTPLTRTLQLEALGITNHVLGQRIKILVAECTPPGTTVGILSRQTWEFQSDKIKTMPDAEMDIKEIGAASDLQSALSQKQYDILILSAHGVYKKEHNFAAVQCGKDVLLGDQLENVPPLVILSACHVSPRALGAVTITDMLLRQGAVAILGTLIPVNVRHNAILVVRFLTNIFEARAGRLPFTAISEIWNHVQSSNAINDIISSNSALKEWATTRVNGESPLEKFMLKNSTGRLRKAHIYQDTVKVLREIAVEAKIQDKYDTWTAGDNYLPESMFYMLMGYADTLFVRDPMPANSPGSIGDADNPPQSV